MSFGENKKRAEEARKRAQDTGFGCIQASLLEVGAKSGCRVPSLDELNSLLPPSHLTKENGVKSEHVHEVIVKSSQEIGLVISRVYIRDPNASSTMPEEMKKQVQLIGGETIYPNQTSLVIFGGEVKADGKRGLVHSESMTDGGANFSKAKAKGFEPLIIVEFDRKK